MTELTQWLSNFIINFRGAYEKLSDDERKHVSNSDDYRSPCQLEVLWLEEPEFQMLIVTHSSTRKDLEIIVNEPFNAKHFLKEAEELLKEPRWDEGPSVFLPRFTEKIIARYAEEHYADELASQIARFVEYVKDSIFRDPSYFLKPSRNGGTMFGQTGWIWTVNGNLCDMNEKLMIDEIITAIKKETISHEKTKVEKPKPQRINGFGTYFYPPIWIGEFPKPTPKERLYGKFYFNRDKKAFDTSFGDYSIVLNSNGFLAVTDVHKEDVLKIFNTIMGISMLLGLPSTAVREKELAGVTVDPSTMTIRGRAMYGTTLRSSLFTIPDYSKPYTNHFHSRRSSQTEMQDIFNKAAKIWKSSEKSELLRFLLEAFTHFSNTEYSQAFIMGWIILEKYISELWMKYLKDEKIKGKRKEKLLNHLFWSTDPILEALCLNNQITQDEYKLYIQMKKRRNGFIHRRKLIEKDDADKCIKLATKIVKTRLQRLISIS